MRLDLESATCTRSRSHGDWLLTLAGSSWGTVCPLKPSQAGVVSSRATQASLRRDAGLGVCTPRESERVLGAQEESVWRPITGRGGHLEQGCIKIEEQGKSQRPWAGSELAAVDFAKRLGTSEVEAPCTLTVERTGRRPSEVRVRAFSAAFGDQGANAGSPRCPPGAERPWK